MAVQVSSLLGAVPTQASPALECEACPTLRREVARLSALLAAAEIELPAGDPDDVAMVPRGMSVRQVEVGKLVAQGYSNAQIADSLYLGVNSVKTHVRGLFRSLGVHNRTEAALYFVRLGLAGPASDDDGGGADGVRRQAAVMDLRS